jgi:hypothetical protein
MHIYDIMAAPKHLRRGDYPYGGLRSRSGGLRSPIWGSEIPDPGVPTRVRGPDLGSGVPIWGPGSRSGSGVPIWVRGPDPGPGSRSGVRGPDPPPGSRSQDLRPLRRVQLDPMWVITPLIGLIYPYSPFMQ